MRRVHGPLRSAMRPIALLAAALAGPLLLTGCDQMDPLKRDYMWHPSDSNMRNIAAMAANPADLRRGRHADRRRVAGEADGVERLWNNKTTPLPGGAAGSSGASSGSGGASAAGGGT